MTAPIQLFRRFSVCTAAATGAEYAICICLLIVVAIAAISALGGVTRVVGDVSGAISQQSLDGPSAASFPFVARTE